VVSVKNDSILPLKYPLIDLRMFTSCFVSFLESPQRCFPKQVFLREIDVFPSQLKQRIREVQQFKI